MTTLDTPTSLGTARYDNADLQQKAKDHLWMHFARQSTMETSGVPDHHPRRGPPHLRHRGQASTSTDCRDSSW